MCTELFGFSETQVAAQVKASNDHYGGNRPAGSRIMYPNGNVDPWHGI